MSDLIRLSVPANDTIHLIDGAFNGIVPAGEMNVWKKAKKRNAIQITFIGPGSMVLIAKRGPNQWPLCVATVEATVAGGAFTELKVRERLKKGTPSNSNKEPRRFRAVRTNKGLLLARGDFRFSIKIKFDTVAAEPSPAATAAARRSGH